MKNCTMKDYYSLLEIEFTASEEEIRKAYRRLVLKYHPDRNPDPQAAKKFIEITEAYETLIDTEKRKKYDEQYIKLLKNKALAKISFSEEKTPPKDSYTWQSDKVKNKSLALPLLLLVAILLFIGVANLPYGYYTLLRIIVFIAGGILIFTELDKQNYLLFILAAVITILFNPIIPIYLDKETWQILDLLTGIFFLIEALRWRQDEI